MSFSSTILFKIDESWYRELCQVWYSVRAYVLMLMSPVNVAGVLTCLCFLCLYLCPSENQLYASR